jgi:RNA polymerase sigma-70 factor (ECF subfamily)
MGLLADQLSADRNFERLYRRHVGDVYRYAAALLANPSDAEDVTQTTFLNAYRAMSDGQQPQKPLNWLITIAHNVCRQRFRQQARRPSEVELDQDIGTELVDEERPRADDLVHALSLLAFNQRAALVMRELEGRSYAEIAETLSVSTSAVETLLFRARRALREQLESAIACDEAEQAISLQLDGMLGRRERGALRAHLRACPECAALARRVRAERSSFRSLLMLPIPQSLLGLQGLTAGASGLLLKAAAVTVAGVAISGAGYEAATHPAALRLASSHAAVVRHAPAPVIPYVVVAAPRTPSVATHAQGLRQHIFQQHSQFQQHGLALGHFRKAIVTTSRLAPKKAITHGKHRGLQQKTRHYKPLTKHSTRHGSPRHLLK